MPESRFDLKRALLASALLHLLLLLLSPVLSWDWADEPEPVEETVLKFDLTPAKPEPEPPPVAEPLPEIVEQPEPEPPPPSVRAVPAQPSPEPPAVEPKGGPEEGDDPEYRTPVPGFEEPVPAETLPAPSPRPVPEQRPPQGQQDPSPREEPGAGALPLPEADPGRPEADAGDAPEARESIESLERALDELSVPRTEEPPLDSPEKPGALDLPDSMSFSTRGFQFGALDVRWESGDPRLVSYARQMLVYLNRVYLRRQYLERGRFERWAYGNDWLPAVAPVRFHFTVNRNGEIENLVFETLSGVQPRDDVIRATMAEAVLQPLPPDFPGQSERFTLLAPGGFRLPIREYVRWLTGMQRAGAID